MTWAISWQALYDTCEKCKDARCLLASYHDKYCGEITFIPGDHFASMFDTREHNRVTPRKALRSISEMVNARACDMDLSELPVAVIDPYNVIIAKKPTSSDPNGRSQGINLLRVHAAQWYSVTPFLIRARQMGVTEERLFPSLLSTLIGRSRQSPQLDLVRNLFG